MKKKIALVISSEELKNWSGGMSYFSNLIAILNEIKQVDLIVYTDSYRFIKYKINSNCKKIIELDFLKKNSFFFLIRKFIIFFLKKDLLLFKRLIKDNISILSHRRLFKNNNIISIGWIPDLQHRVFKNIFVNNFYKDRENYVLKELENSDYIFVSSNQIKKEFKKYYNVQNKIIPLKIPVKINKIKNVKKQNFILFPSQFWKHKNHFFLIKVAKILKKRNINIKFLFCGKAEDYRHKNHFRDIKNSISKNFLNKNIIILGEVSKNKLLQLQKKCVAMINPSLYEGWSTINEEAKTFNKFIFLSKILGHIEQSNPGAIYFSLNDPKELSNKIIKFLKNKTFNNEKFLYKKNVALYKKVISETKKSLLKIYQI